MVWSVQPLSILIGSTCGPCLVMTSRFAWDIDCFGQPAGPVSAWFLICACHVFDFLARDWRELFVWWSVGIRMDDEFFRWRNNSDKSSLFLITSSSICDMDQHCLYEGEVCCESTECEIPACHARYSWLNPDALETFLRDPRKVLTIDCRKACYNRSARERCFPKIQSLHVGAM